MKRQLLIIGLASASALALGAAVTALVVALVLHDEVGTLEQRARKAARQEKALKTEIAALRSDFEAAVRIETAAPVAAIPPVAEIPAVAMTLPVAAENIPVVAARAAPARVATAPATFVKVGASPSECIFHPGDPGGLMECIQRADTRKPARPGYR